MSDPKIDLSALLKRFGGAPGLHARLARSPHIADTISPGTVRAWKTRGALPAQLVLPVMLMLRDEGEDPFDFLDTPEPETINPFEGLTWEHPQNTTET